MFLKIYSEREYELTMDGLKEVFGFSNEEIRAIADKGHTALETIFSVKFSQKRKDNTEPYAILSLKKEGSTQMLDKDLFYGLFILGTEKHESRRIDNQLRGRAGRQGDPGISVFFVALDDTLMRKMGGEKMQSLAGMLLGSSGLSELELTQKQFTKSIIRAQKEIEGWYFGIRKHLFDYDSVTDKQRKKVYKIRDQILESETDEQEKASYLTTMKAEFLEGAKSIIASQVLNAENTGQPQTDLLLVLNKEYGLSITKEQHHELSQLDYLDLKAVLLDRLERYFAEVFEKIDPTILANLFREVHLHFIDTLWVNHIDEMQNLRDKVGLMAYAQLDPLVMYKKESYDKFQELLASIQSSTAGYLLKIDYMGLIEQAQAPMISLGDEGQQGNVVNLLAAASKGFKVNYRANSSAPKAQQPIDQRAKVFEKGQDFEVFEVEEE